MPPTPPSKHPLAQTAAFVPRTKRAGTHDDPASPAQGAATQIYQDSYDELAETRVRDSLEDRRTGRELLATAFEPPSRELLADASPDYVAVAPDSANPDSHIRFTRGAPVSGHQLPEGAPEWMLQARELSLRLERMISAGRIERHEQLAITRASLGYGLVGSSPARVARVAHLVHRAHAAIREIKVESLPSAIQDCAEILLGGLPSGLRRVTPFESVREVVQGLYNEADSWVAVVEGTSLLLGWHDAGRIQAASAIRVAIEDRHLRTK